MGMREEFEAAFTDHMVMRGMGENATAMLEMGSDGEYRSIRVNGAWWGWQASRAVLVIELPTSVTHSGTAYIETVRVFIEKQGLNTK